MKSNSNYGADTRESDEVTQNRIVKAAETKDSDTACQSEQKEAEKVLDTAADDAKKAERFDHGEKDAGTKR